MGTKKLADSFFRGGPVDSLLTVDAYKAKEQSVLNNLPSVLENTATDAVTAIKKDPNILKNLARDIQGINDKTLSKATVLSRLGNSLGSSSIMRGLTGDVQSGVFKAFDALGVNKDSAGAILGATKSGISQYMRGDLDDLRGIASLASEFSGQAEIFEIFDLAAEAAVLSSIMDYAIQAGAVELIEDAINSASTEEVIQTSYLNNVRTAIGYGDIATLNKLIDRIGVGGALSQVPDAIKYILQSYRIPAGNTSVNYETLLSGLVATLVRLDPNWDRYNRNGEWITTLEPFTYASTDSRALFSTDENYLDQVMMAVSYPAVDTVNHIRSFYPMVVI